MKKVNIFVTVEQINQVLPQTQCTLCGYDGCKPYANAIVHEGESIDRCPPGGVRGLLKLAQITDQDATPFIKEMQTKEKPILRAVIREAECIGCTKCIQACPVDAIMGAAKLMHTVITDECTGCELCVEPCPVDCIDILSPGFAQSLNETQEKDRADHYRKRYENRNERLLKESSAKKQNASKNIFIQSQSETLEDKKRFLLEALKRAEAKK